MIESGLPDFDMTGGMGVFAAAGTPKEALDRLSAELVRTLQLPEVKAGLIKDGFIVSAVGTTEYNTYVRARMQAIQKIAKEAKIKVE